mmetsp:Transcript_1546/g.3118  ORF Transcript_1546/g.3118 Transcript_1546/m.3118 type:complete len:80 (-) Transcript_1546:24-263(-)
MMESVATGSTLKSVWRVVAKATAQAHQAQELLLLHPQHLASSSGSQGREQSCLAAQERERQVRHTWEGTPVSVSWNALW